MNNSQRIEYIVNKIKLNERVIDIGTDHAKVPINIYKKDITRHVTATEVAQGPYNIALDNLKNNNLESKIRLVLSNGFEKISPRQFDTIIIAGMGGTLIKEILSLPKTKYRARLILHPTNNHDVIRKHLSKIGYEIIDETLITEGKADNIIIEAQRNVWNTRLTKTDILLGPVLSKSDDPAVKDFFIKKLDYYKNIYNKSNNNKILKKIKIIEKRMNDEKRNNSKQLK